MPSEERFSLASGLLVALLMIASQVAGKATRDALFLSTFEITALPTMIVIAAIVSFAAVLIASRTMALYGPSRIIPGAFMASGMAMIAEWHLLPVYPEAAAIIVYIHETVVGSILISGFWSIVNESYDPQEAKKSIAYFGCAGSAGGLVGSILAQSIAAELSVSSMLPFLAAMHVLCACFVRGLRGSPARELKEKQRSAAIAAESKAFGSAFRILRRTSYARNLALLIMLAAGSAVLVKYAFQAQAASMYRGEELLKFFANFYMIASLLTFLVQSSLSRFFLERLGGARTVAALPTAVGISAIFGVIFPGFTSAVITGGIDSVLRNSVFRAGYESLYVPVAKRIKRSTKSIIDVGFDRIGSTVGGGVIQLLILFGAGTAGSLILAIAAFVSMIGLLVAVRLRFGYIDALEKRLLKYSGSVADITERVNPLEFVASERGFLLSKIRTDSIRQTNVPKTQAKEDTLSEQFAILRSGESESVKKVLSNHKLNPILASQVIELLESDEVLKEALRALQGIAPSIRGLLTDVLLSGDHPPKIRRLVPRILSFAPSKRTVEALIAGFNDPIFDVRFQCGLALAEIRHNNPEISIDQEVVYEALRRELESDRFVAEYGSLLDHPEGSYLAEGLPMEQVNRQLEHAFTVLSLVVGREPLKIAFRGLHSTEEGVRGTAVEYLASLLPSHIRPRLLLAVEQMTRPT